MTSHPDDGVTPFTPYNSRYHTKAAVSQMNHALSCQGRIGASVPGEDPMQTRARREMMLGTAAWNFRQASSMGIVFQ